MRSGRTAGDREGVFSQIPTHPAVSQLTGPQRLGPMPTPTLQPTVAENKVPGSCQPGSLSPVRGNPKAEGAWVGIRGVGEEREKS